MMRVQSLLFRLLCVVTLDVFPKNPYGETAWVGFAPGFALGFNTFMSAVTQRQIAQGVEPLWVFINP